jgi:hypothetical protein
MATQDRYATPPGGLDWEIPGSFATTFRWEYEDGRESLLKLYGKGKQRQWDAADRIDWSQDLDPENPEQLPDETIPIFGSAPFERLDRAGKAELRRHFQAWQLSQFMHGEQGALICTAKIVQQVPSMDAKFYAATQVIDEARHVEAYSRLLHDKFDLVYPINPHLKTRSAPRSGPRRAGPEAPGRRLRWPASARPARRMRRSAPPPGPAR